MKLDIEELSKVRLAPEDVLVLHLAAEPPGDYLEHISKGLKDYFPNNKVVVLGPGARFEVYTGGVA